MNDSYSRIHNENFSTAYLDGAVIFCRTNILLKPECAWQHVSFTAGRDVVILAGIFIYTGASVLCLKHIPNLGVLERLALELPFSLLILIRL